MSKHEEQARFIILRGQGLSYQRIAEILNVSKSSCISWGRKFADDIASAKRAYMDDLQKEYNLTAIGQVEKLTKHLEAIEKAVNDVEKSGLLVTLPPDKLYKLYFDTMSLTVSIISNFKICDELKQNNSFLDLNTSYNTTDRAFED